jgi:hypothetical protein
LDNENKLILSKEAKQEYLKKLSKRMVKILCLIEEEKETGNNPEGFILGQLFEINAANCLFDFHLTDIVIKLNGILNYTDKPFNIIRKQIFEAKGIIDYLYKNII